ncbi:SCNM1 protein, partial [Scytalopus superciliaris]|nr:SCNM1 protein [Scytalopus superciliaris]
QRRRVSDLLANSIPEDEAVLLRSGRFACSVCPHRPVCDTLEALAVHRAGRRHLHSLQRSYGRNRSFQPAAPAAPGGLRGGVTSPGGPPGDPLRCQGCQGCQECQAPLLARTRRIARSALLKSAPYSSCCRRKGAQGSSSQAGHPRTVPEPLRDVGESRDVKGSREVKESPALLPGHGQGRAGVSKAAPTRKGKSCLEQDELSPERRRVLQHLLYLRSSGWIQDPSGKWVKDGNAEFDSDEEEPPALPPT